MQIEKSTRTFALLAISLLLSIGTAIAGNGVPTAGVEIRMVPVMRPIVVGVRDIGSPRGAWRTVSETIIQEVEFMPVAVPASVAAPAAQPSQHSAARVIRATQRRKKQR